MQEVEVIDQKEQRETLSQTFRPMNYFIGVSHFYFSPTILVFM